MFVDSQLRFSNAQAVTAAAISTNILDLGAVRNLGTGKPLFVVICVTTAFTDAGSNSTLTVSLYGDSTSTITPDSSRDLVTIAALAAAGTVAIIPLAPNGGPEAYRYLALYYTPNNGDLTTGAITAFITDTPQAQAFYAKGYSIS